MPLASSDGGHLWRSGSPTSALETSVGLALIELITNPQFELTGVCVSTPEKVGKDAGELAGLDVSTGIAAVNDLDAVARDPTGMRRVLRDG